MPEHVRSIECCYCGASTFVNLREVNKNSLKCGECGAGMSVSRMGFVSKPAVAIPNREIPARSDSKDRSKSEPRLAKQWEEKRGRRDDDDRKKKPKRKKKKGFFDRLEDIWDEVEDIFD